MPLGRPVVPDEYSMAVPMLSSAIGVPGSPAVASCKPMMRSLSLAPSTTMQSSTFGHCRSASRATSSFAADVMRMRDSLLAMM